MGGAMMPYAFAAWTMKSVGTAANDMVKECMRQFPRIMGGADGARLRHLHPHLHGSLPEGDACARCPRDPEPADCRHRLRQELLRGPALWRARLQRAARYLHEQQRWCLG